MLLAKAIPKVRVMPHLEETNANRVLIRFIQATMIPRLLQRPPSFVHH